MTDSTVLDLCRQAFLTALYCSGPVLGVMLVVGLLVSILQAVTQVQEATLTFLPKMLGAGVVILVGGHWMLQQLVGLATQLWGNFGQYIR